MRPSLGAARPATDRTSPGARGRRVASGRIAVDLLGARALALIVAALVPGVWTTSRLHWGFDLDHFRDIAIAQSMQDGRWFDDAFCAGERAWYNPLVRRSWQ